MENAVSMTEGMIAAVLDEARGRIAQLERQHDEIGLALTVAKEEEQLLLKLMALRQEPKQVSSSRSTKNRVVDPAKHAVHSMDDEPIARQPAIESVARELAAAGRPIHISELMRLLDEKKIRVPGAGTQANLITHLRRDPRFVRPSRGMYGLAAWGLENMPATVKRKKRKHRAKSPKPSERKVQ